MGEPTGGGRGSGMDRCDFCQSPIPRAPVTLERDGAAYTFCTEACRDAMQDREQVFTEYRGHRWVNPGVSALEASLPQGLLRNSFVLLSAQPGTRDGALRAEVAWRALQRGEPAVFVAFQEPPVSLVERFLSLGWNVLPYLESGEFHILDCFTYRLQDRARMFDRMNDWNAHLHKIAEPETTAVRDPTNIGELENRLDDCTSAKSMADSGVVVIDSLTEFGALVQPVRAYDFLKDTRAEICKGRFVPIFAGAAYVGDAEQFPHDLEYLFDGIVDLELNPKIVEDTLIKRVRIRKMGGVLAYSEWTAYEFTAGEGLVMFDPLDEMESTTESTAGDQPTGEDDAGA